MTLRELGIVVAATVRVLADSNRTSDIQRVAEIVARRRFCELAARMRHDDPALLRERPLLAPDLEALRRLPQDTLGGAFVRHLDRNGLELYDDELTDEFVRDPDARYLIVRYRQVHDVWHVLLGLGTRGHEEVLVHAFTLGRLGLPNSVMIVVLGTLKHIVLERRWSVLRRDLWAAYRAGRSCRPLLGARWERCWSESLADVRARYEIDFRSSVN